MTPEQKMAFIMHIYALIFASKQTGTAIGAVGIKPEFVPFVVSGEYVKGRWFVNGTIRGFDLALITGEAFPLPLRLIEQNPLKMKNGSYSQYAVAAQNGSQIMWVIGTADNKFFGRVQDGQWHKNEERAVSAAPPADNLPTETMGPEGTLDVNNVELIEGDIPEHVLNHYAEMSESEY